MMAEEATDKWKSVRNGLARRDVIRIRALRVSLIVAVTALVGLLMAGILWSRHLDFGDLVIPDEETRVSRYEALLKDWHSSGLVNHFPAGIPSHAENVGLSAFPGFMMSGTWLQVRLQLPAPEVRQIYDEAMKNARQYYDGGDSLTLVNARDDGLGSTDFHTSGTPDLCFPDDYRVFVLDAVDGGSPGYSWNHGRSKGIVVSLSRNEVIYFAERW